LMYRTLDAVGINSSNPCMASRGHSMIFMDVVTDYRKSN
jgi:hypothetical protein